MRKVVTPYLDAILTAIDAIEQYRPDSYEQFRDDPMRADAILMRLIEIGEIMHTIRDDYPDAFESHHQPDWHKIVALRHIIAHEYGKVNLAIIWEIITDKLPPFRNQIQEWFDEKSTSN